MYAATSSLEILSGLRPSARQHRVHGRLRLALWLSIAIGMAAATLGARPASAAQTILVACAAPQLEGTLNLNTASVDELDLLPGVGPATADKIVRYREKHPFRSVRQLMRVDGIGPKSFDRLKPYLTVEGESTLHVVSPPS
jgi:competence ComEA-like helix-hairpin-helix protein